MNKNINQKYVRITLLQSRGFFSSSYIQVELLRVIAFFLTFPFSRSGIEKRDTFFFFKIILSPFVCLFGWFFLSLSLSPLPLSIYLSIRFREISLSGAHQYYYEDQ